MLKSQCKYFQIRHYAGFKTSMFLDKIVSTKYFTSLNIIITFLSVFIY